MQVQPFLIWQLMQPSELMFPESQVSAPMTSPSPHFGTQTPAELGAYPAVAQVVH